MERINLIKNQLASKEKIYVNSAYDYLNFDQFLSKPEREYRKTLRKYLEKIEPKLNEFNDRREFPLEICKDLVKNFPGIVGLSLKGFGSAGFSNMMTNAIIMEFGRCDLSLGSFLLVHGGELVMKSIYLLGSEEHRNKYLPRMNQLDLIGSFCLTEPDYGSDASSLKTTALEDGDCYLINGTKRWIGNATNAGIFIVWARNTTTNQVEGYLVEKENTTGIEIIPHADKLSTRSVQNANVVFNNVRIPKGNKLPGATNFITGTNKMLLGSRVDVAWLVVGACIGAYDKVIEYCSNRKQFKKPLTAFQITQEKLSRMMANIQAMMYLTHRCACLSTQNELSIGQAGMCKAFCTKLSRETVAVAREMLGGNGILLENKVMKIMMDLESCHSYEGTYDINMLVCGRELTGISAFK